MIRPNTILTAILLWAAWVILAAVSIPTGTADYGVSVRSDAVPHASALRARCTKAAFACRRLFVGPALIKDATAKLDRDSLYFHFPHYYGMNKPASAVCRGDWKLREYLEDGRVELYDLKEDIGERKNLASTHKAQVTLVVSFGTGLHRLDVRMPKPKPKMA
jgi:hypothetical protein